MTTENKQEPELIVDMTPTRKGLDFTKAQYEQLATELKKELETASDKNTKQYQELYGMYYCAVIGLLRSGVLCSRASGKDGFPEIRVYTNSDTFTCSENVIYSIIGAEEAKDLITPYEDTSNSYIKDFGYKNMSKTFTPEVPTSSGSSTSKKGSSKQDESIRKELEELKKEKKKSESEATAKYNDLLSRYNKLRDESSNLPIVSSQEEANTVNEFREKFEEASSNAEALKKELAEWKAKYSDAEKSVQEAEKETKRLQNKLNIKEAEAKKYVYDPNYDHYYSDELPAIIESLEFNHMNTIVRSGAIVACGAGIIFSLLMFI